MLDHVGMGVCRCTVCECKTGKWLCVFTALQIVDTCTHSRWYQCCSSFPSKCICVFIYVSVVATVCVCVFVVDTVAWT